MSEPLPSKGTILYHNKGYFNLVVTDSFTDTLGNGWILAFNADNASQKFKQYDGSFMKQFDEDPNNNVDPSHMVYEKFYQDNVVRAFSLDRVYEKFSLVAPENPSTFTPIRIAGV